ncbi:MAG TPA: DUF3040 domain-containing protein [Nakamurella sp.]|nr:DUF3040 domain-containing protein [Nakamurella sp.]
MALSNHEQRTLDEIERALRDEDPVFVHTVDLGRLRLRRMMMGALVFLLGMVVLLLGEVASQAQMAVGVCVGVAGFATMFAAAAWVVSPSPPHLTLRRRPRRPSDSDA